ncbi:L-type lectin-domain containing receptor kinase IX.1-like [Papaver somniferum]|uniref:L-type lectin-domain containing receptor kinase IX.1-like n=1 Tax=Papaver somniferum TaxID=3469 RepID=UPI000E6F7DDD|nr:L-type lectin-domain containing receptor kinase IX.1-like [Papaver somniferum]
MDDVLLWDSTTGRVTDFETHFSFIMLAVDNLSYGDGITFFLAPKWSKLPPDSHGGYLGLLSKDKATDNSTQNQIVSVEFDSWRNDWDPSPDNVGINVNSVVSVANVTWKSSIKDGRKGNAWRFSKLRHRNLVQLVGWSHERDELLLVYEFMPNGSLDNHLFRGEADLTWEVRYKIALGLASALLYLHEDWEQCVVHRDIKSSNVMLDSNFNAKLGDFGLASFGIVALEIACGRKPYEADVGFSLVEWVWGLYGGGKIVEAADERLRMDFNELEMEQLMVVGLWCAHLDSKSRPSETQVLNVLKFESPLPKLPLELPIPVYLPALPFAPDLPSFAGFTDTLTPR